MPALIVLVFYLLVAGGMAFDGGGGGPGWMVAGWAMLASLVLIPVVLSRRPRRPRGGRHATPLDEMLARRRQD